MTPVSIEIEEFQEICQKANVPIQGRFVVLPGNTVRSLAYAMRDLQTVMWLMNLVFNGEFSVTFRRVNKDSGLRVAFVSVSCGPSAFFGSDTVETSQRNACLVCLNKWVKGEP